MNKIVCLLVASLVCVGVASEVNPAVVAIINNLETRLNGYLLQLANDVTRMFAGSDLINEDALALLKAGTDFSNAVGSILAGKKGNREKIAAEFKKIVTPIKDKMMDYVAPRRLAGVTSARSGYDLPMIFNKFHAMNRNVDLILDAAFSPAQQKPPKS